MVLNKTSKVNDIDSFDIVVGVLKGDYFAQHLFIICLDYVIWTSIDLIKENDFRLKKPKSRRYPTETITSVDHAADIEFLAHTPTKAESPLHSLE